MRRDVEFKSGNDTIKAFLYTPDSGRAPWPVVVMAGGWCYVKELIQPHYAQKFVNAGFAVLLFDYRYLGASGGQPRQHVNPSDQIEDYKNAISFVETHSELDGSRIGVWGISYSGGHVLVVGATDERVKCIVSNIPVVDGWDNMRRAHGTVGFRKLMAAVTEDRRNRYQTGQPSYMAMSGDNTKALVTWPFPETYTAFMKLKETEAPAHEHRNTIESVELLMSYNIFPYLPRILNTPTLMVVADHDDLTLWDREVEAFNQIASPRKRAVVIPETTHMTLYSNLSRLEIAANVATEWFTDHLLEPHGWVGRYGELKAVPGE